MPQRETESETGPLPRKIFSGGGGYAQAALAIILVDPRAGALMLDVYPESEVQWRPVGAAIDRGAAQGPAEHSQQ